MESFEQLLQALHKLNRIEGATPVDVLDLPDPLGRVFGIMIRKGSMQLSEMTLEMDMPQDQVRLVADILTQKGFFVKEFRSGKELTYKPYLARMRNRNIPLDL